MGLSNYVPSSRVSQAGVCTSSTRPASPYEGQMIYETDTDLLRVWTGAAWGSPKLDNPLTIRSSSVDRNIPFAFASGQTAAIVAANTYYTITLPTDRFTQAPRIVATATNPSIYGQTIVIADVTTSSFKIASNAVCYLTDWIAIQMTSSASSG